MSQPRVVTVDEIVSLLRSGEKPVFTVTDIADEFGVSDETIRRRMSEVTEREGVQERQIGKADVYWYSHQVGGESPGQATNQDRRNGDKARVQRQRGDDLEKFKDRMLVAFALGGGMALTVWLLALISSTIL